MREELRKFVVANYLFGQDIEFSDDDSFLENGIIDSTGILELTAFLEVSYHIVVEDDELLPENLDSINKLIRFLDKKLQAAVPQESRLAG